MGRLLIIGLDGADFGLITPWVQAGKLPQLAALLEDGVHGALKSTVPPMSPPAWTSFMTGKNPGKHGILDFTARKPQSYEIEFVNARWRQADTIWKLLSTAGKRVCVLSVPMTYPPEKINGIMISGFDTPAPGGVADPSAIHPTEVYDELVEKLGGYFISPNLKAFHGYQCDEMVQAALRTVERKMETALYLFPKEPWDCFMITIGESDGITHRLWKYHDKTSPLSDEYSVRYAGEDPILRIYQKIDHYIGKLCSMASADTTIIIMSDHGHGGNSLRAIYLNRWLAELNLLRFVESATGNFLTSICTTAKNVGVKVVPAPVRKMIFRKTQLANKMESWLRFSHIDWSRTQAYSEETPYFPSIWINVQGREPAGIVKPGKEYEEVRESLIQVLSRWVDPETGQRVVRKVHKREEIYAGPCVERFPDLIIEWSLDTHGYSYLFKNSQRVTGRPAAICRLDEQEKQKSKSGDHRDYGIFIAAGQMLKQHTELHGAELIDLAPTILHLLGLPIPVDMDGQVLTQILTEDLPPVRYCSGPAPEAERANPYWKYSKEEEEALRTRLEGLGYLE